MKIIYFTNFIIQLMSSVYFFAPVNVFVFSAIKSLADAGVDIRSAKFWQGGFDVLSKMVDELEKL